VISTRLFSSQVVIFDKCGNLVCNCKLRSGHAPGEFSDPRGIAVNRNGDIYISDTDNNRIQIFKFSDY